VSRPAPRGKKNGVAPKKSALRRFFSAWRSFVTKKNKRAEKKRGSFLFFFLTMSVPARKRTSGEDDASDEASSSLTIYTHDGAEFKMPLSLVAQSKVLRDDGVTTLSDSYIGMEALRILVTGVKDFTKCIKEQPQTGHARRAMYAIQALGFEIKKGGEIDLFQRNMGMYLIRRLIDEASQYSKEAMVANINAVIKPALEHTLAAAVILDGIRKKNAGWSAILTPLIADAGRKYMHIDWDVDPGNMADAYVFVCETVNVQREYTTAEALEHFGLSVATIKQHDLSAKACLDDGKKLQLVQLVKCALKCYGSVSGAILMAQYVRDRARCAKENRIIHHNIMVATGFRMTLPGSPFQRQLDHVFAHYDGGELGWIQKHPLVQAEIKWYESVESQLVATRDFNQLYKLVEKERFYKRVRGLEESELAQPASTLQK